jgi:GLPGLI family protein
MDRTMPNALRFLLQFFLLALLGAGCSSGLRSKALTEGTIEYSLCFPEYDPNGLMAGMLPEKTTLYFTPDQQLADLSAGMGVFRTSMVVNTPKHEMDYHMSVMSKKLVSTLSPRDLAMFNQESQAVSIIYTDERDSIAGYPCRKALALFNGLNEPEVELWYTDAIDIQQPNWFGPYAEIPGVLLQYEMVQYGMRMRLTATSITPGPVDQQKFAPREDFQHVEPAVLHKELEEVLSTFAS